jgi:hypothetical protein
MRGKYLVTTVLAITLMTAGGLLKAADNGMRARAESSFDEATRIANEMTAQRENTLQYAIRRAQEMAVDVKAAEEALKLEPARPATAGEVVSGSGRERTQNAYSAYAESLHAFRQFQDPERLEALLPALDSQSNRVRRAALEALRDGTVHDEAVLGKVRDMVTNDSDPSVQREALEVYARYGNRSEVLSLVQSLGRLNGPTRDIAVREWLRIEKEMADALLGDEQLEAARK